MYKYSIQLDLSADIPNNLMTNMLLAFHRCFVTGDGTMPLIFRVATNPQTSVPKAVFFLPSQSL
ncbi:MAG: hypothetical protein IPN46_19155 [Saprospiraceae bacterium]|nr:hypothetical protein [Saprospiraceae bacterium]